eukprot:1656790-Prymnesium_polylepis.2
MDDIAAPCWDDEAPHERRTRGHAVTIALRFSLYASSLGSCSHCLGFGWLANKDEVVGISSDAYIVSYSE